jgi:hypothetical protein
MALPFNLSPLLGALPELSNLGIGQAKAVGQGINIGENLTAHQVDAAIQSWRDRYQSLIKEAGKAGPTPQNAARAGTAGNVAAGLLAGLLGAGPEAGMAAMADQGAPGAAIVEQQNLAAQQAHLESIKAAAEGLQKMDEVSKGIRMLLQAQPELFQGEMMRLASEIALPGTGLELSVKPGESGLDPSTAGLVSALDFVIKSNDVDNPETLRQLHGLRASLASGRSIEFGTTDFFDPSLGIDADKLMREAVNGRRLASQWQATGTPPDPNDIVWRTTVADPLPDMMAKALMRWAQLQMEGMTETEALTQLKAEDPAGHVELVKRYGPERVGGEPDLSVVGKIALNTYLRQGPAGQVMGGGFGNLDFYNEEVSGYIAEEKVSRARKKVETINAIWQQMVDRYRDTGLGDEAAEEKASKYVRSQFKSQIKEIPEELLREAEF